MPTIAVVSFPGNNCEVEAIRSLKRVGFDVKYFRWNDEVSNLQEVDAYFLPGGFSYEDRGRAGMVAARDPVLAHIVEEANAGKPVVGVCNGAQVLVETGLIPNGEHLQMSLARNAAEGKAIGFLNEWVWITPTCERGRCCTSDWEGAMHIPIAHGEGRFTTKDRELLEELQKNNQIAFCYCDEQGAVAEDLSVTPNGSSLAIAGVCNPAGNVVALMPHPERTMNGDSFFRSMKGWIENRSSSTVVENNNRSTSVSIDVGSRQPKAIEIFIDTKIVNNEERTVEATARSFAPRIQIRQMKYVSISSAEPKKVLDDIARFNPNKEMAFIRRNGVMHAWDSDSKTEDVCEDFLAENRALLRIDNPDTGAYSSDMSSQSGVCYLLSGVSDEDLLNTSLLEVFANPHASTLEELTV